MDGSSLFVLLISFAVAFIWHSAEKDSRNTLMQQGKLLKATVADREWPFQKNRGYVPSFQFKWEHEALCMRSIDGLGSDAPSVFLPGTPALILHNPNQNVVAVVGFGPFEGLVTELAVDPMGLEPTRPVANVVLHGKLL